MYYLVDESKKTEATLGIVIRGFHCLRNAHVFRNKMPWNPGLMVAIYGLGKRWRVGQPAPREDWEAWQLYVAEQNSRPSESD